MDHEQAREFLRYAIPDLENYLLSDKLYWQVRSDFVSLTIGNLLFENKIIYAYDRSESRKFSEQINVIQGKWQVHWKNKVLREIKNRIKLWAEFLEQTRNEGSVSEAYYRTSVRQRVIITLLNHQNGSSDIFAELHGLDQIVLGLKPKSGFVWQQELRIVFPEDEYWFLY